MRKRIKEFVKYKSLFGELVRKGIKLKYRRSYLGLLWSLVEPLLTMLVLTVVFSTLLGYDDKSFPVYILSGRLIYSLFSQSTTNALKSIRANQGMIKKVYIPKYMYPVSGVCFNYILFLISLVVLAGVSLTLGVYPTMKTLMIIVPLFILFICSIGCGLVLSVLGTLFRDMEYLWNVGLMIVMYACAIFYYPDKILDSNVAWILKYNPLFCIIDNFRSCIFGNDMNIGFLGFSAGFSVILLIVGVNLFERNQDKFILYI